MTDTIIALIVGRSCCGTVKGADVTPDKVDNGTYIYWRIKYQEWKGGEVNMFDDFDIDYNQQKYLMETRMSGALVKPYTAIAIKIEAQG